MFKPPSPPPTSTTMIEDPQHEDEGPPTHMYYQPQVFRKHDEFMEGISKQTLIMLFVAFISGILLGKSMTPIVLRQ
jgi:hypothetical protein